MTTLFRTATAKELSQKRRLMIGGIASAAMLTLCLVGTGPVRGQISPPPPLQIIGLASGSASEPEAVNLHVDGTNNVLLAHLVFQPGGQTGWHTHPGPVVVVVQTGALTEIHSNGCVTVHPQGSVFFEKKDELHNAINQTGGVTDVYATFLSPAGAQPLIPGVDPGGVCRSGL